MKNKLIHFLLPVMALASAAHAATITVNTVNNVNPAAGETSLVQALQAAQAGDTIAFNIPGDGPHYIKTPVDGYPLITKNNVTIDGHSQPGSKANTNPIRAANNAVMKIVLDSRDGGRTKMNYGTGRPGYGDEENSILGVFNASNVTIKGLVFLGLHTANSALDPAIYCIAFARDHSGAPNYDDNGHVAGCWFGVDADGTNVVGGSAAAITAFRHRDISGGSLPELPNKNLTVGVKAGSANPRAEFNVMVAMSYHLAGEQTGARFSGNFVGMLPDGKTPYDITVENAFVFGGSSIEIGRYNDSTIVVGTDGDGINDADEGNIFGPLSNDQRVINFYGTGNKQYIIAGNYFGVAVDGVTALPGVFQILGSGFSAAKVRFGSDFDGVSDALEGNLVVNNHPFDPSATVINPITAQAGAKLSVRGNSFVNNYPLPVNMAADTFALNNPHPSTFYSSYLEPVDPMVIQPKITSAGAELIGTAPKPTSAFAATVIDLYEADQEGIDNGKRLNVVELPNGFVQGKRYVASFVDNSAADLDPAAGAFKFNIDSLPLKGKQLTITANYVIGTVGAHNAETVTSPFSEPVAGATSAKTVTVTTTDNSNTASDKTSLVQALQAAVAGDTIAFNIPGPGPHYIKTPVNGYPLIRQNNLTIDGYSQPGAMPNSNPIRAANNAALKIVLDSREGGRTVMNYATGRPGYGDEENSILGIFNASNVTIKGLSLLGLHTANSTIDPAIYCIAFARDHTGAPNYDDNGHIAGCWFGIEPNGAAVTGGSAAAVTAFRHRDISGGSLPELPNKNLTVGVKVGSSNPRAEFNVMAGMSYHLAGEQTGARFSGNFVGMLPDGKTPYDITLENAGAFGGSSIEIGRYNDSTIVVGTDGDGVNDADEGNVFGPLSNNQRVINFYGTGNKLYVVAGNSFGATVEGAALPGAFQILGSGFSASKVQFGTDGDGVSDQWEGNLVVNNHPFDAGATVINPITAQAGAQLSVRGNSFVNNYPLPVNIAADTFALNNPHPSTFYASVLVPTDPQVIQPAITSAGAELAGTFPEAVAGYPTTIIDVYEADPEGIANGKTLNVVELPNGFVQGKRWVASFANNSAADLDADPKKFKLDISSLGLTGKAVTVTATYSVQPLGTHNATGVTSPFSEPAVVGSLDAFEMTITRSGANVTISWPASFTGVTVETTSALTVGGSWTTVPSSGNSVTVPINLAANAFFRLKR